MTPSEFSVALTRQLEDSPFVIQSHGQGSEWGLSEAGVASTYILPTPSMQEEVWQFSDGPSQHPSQSFLHTPNGRYSDLRVPDMDLYTLVNQDQVNLDPVCAGYQSLVFLESNSSFELNISGSASTFLNPVQNDIPRTFLSLEDDLDFVLTDHPAMNEVPQASDEVPGYSTPSIFAPPPPSYEISLDPQLSSLDRYMEANFQIAFPSVDILPPDWDSGQPAAHSLVESPSAFDSADPTAGIDSPSYPGETPQEVNYDAVQSSFYTASPCFDQQSALSEGFVRPCGWKDGDEPVCGEVLTRASLSEHLSTHGIKKKPRDHRMKCNWVGCKLKREINRESIVRHIREVHFRLKRASKRVQDPYL